MGTSEHTRLWESGVGAQDCVQLGGNSLKSHLKGLLPAITCLLFMDFFGKHLLLMV